MSGFTNREARMLIELGYTVEPGDTEAFLNGGTVTIEKLGREDFRVMRGFKQEFSRPDRLVRAIFDVGRIEGRKDLARESLGWT